MTNATARRVKARIQAQVHELKARNPDDPRIWPDADKLRLLACSLDKRDYDRGIYDSNEVQDDLRRIADRLDAIDV